MARFLFFATVREKVGQAMMELPLPPEVTTVGAMLDHLRRQGDPLATALTGSHLRVAVNQVHARPEDPVSDRDDVAIFPPVSGG